MNDEFWRTVRHLVEVALTSWGHTARLMMLLLFAAVVLSFLYIYVL